MQILFLVGRILYGGFMIHAGYNHFRHLNRMSGYVAAKGVPAPKLAVGGTGVLLLLGGLSILLGVAVPIGVLLLVVFLAGTTPTMHAFWADADPMVARNNRTHFLKNLALLGAALAFLAVQQPWAYSLGIRIAL
ncbi:MAG TPA: DoxX family membrane protein [bacterium]|nr:DoxX family membrane protein [bacterium]